MLAFLQSRRRREPTFTPEEVVEALYRGLLDRGPEPPGLAAQLAALEAGAPLHKVVYGIGHSREYFEMWLRGGDPPALATEAWRAAARHPGEAHIYFLHIMKTGGTALVEGLSSLAGDRFCLTQIFLDHLVALPPVVLESAALVAGHLGVEAREMLPDDTLTATALRDPLDRVLSHYAHVLVDPALGSETEGLSLEEFVHSPRWRALSENFQARNLVHRIGLSGVWRRQSPEQMLAQLDPGTRPTEPSLPLQAFFDSTPLGISEGELRRLSLAALNSIDHVGVSDRLDVLFESLCRIWGVENPPALPAANVSAHRLDPAGIPGRLREEILEANSVDLALYEQARVLADAAASDLARHRQAYSGFRPAQAPVIAASLPSPPERAAALRERDPRPHQKVAPPLLRQADRWGLALPLALSAIVVGLDLVLSQQFILMHLLVIGPCTALFTTRWRVTAAIGVAVVIAGNLLAASDGVWDTFTDLSGLITLVVVSVSATAAAAAMERGRSIQAQARLHTSSA